MQQQRHGPLRGCSAKDTEFFLRLNSFYSTALRPYRSTAGGRNLMPQAEPDHPENSIGAGNSGAGDSFCQKKIETNQNLSMDLLRYREKPIKSRHYMKEATARHKER